jgi:hypothetical protein
VTSRPILVLGAECSGATLTAALAGSWGARRADREGAGVAAAQDLMSEVLAAAGGILWSPALAGRAAALAEEPALRERGLAVVAALAGGAAGQQPWLWQVPFPTLLLPFWEGLLGEPILIVAVRNPLDGAASFAKRHLPEKTARQIRLAAYFGFRWQVCNLALLELCERHPDHLFVDYEQMLKAPVEQVRRLGRFLDAATKAAETCDERLLLMLEGVDPSLWHSKSGSLFFELPQVIEEQKQLLRYLRRRAAGVAEPFEPGRFPLPAYAWEYLHNFDVYLAQQEQERAAVGEPAAVAAAAASR